MNAIVRLSVINSGSPHTDQALSFVRQNSFLHSKGARNNAKKIVVVISNGQSTEPNKTAFEVPALRKSGNIAVVAVGVGSGVNKTEMRTIASDPAYMLSVTDFDALQTATSTLAYVACQCKFSSGIGPYKHTFLSVKLSSFGCSKEYIEMVLLSTHNMCLVEILEFAF